jgi:hypothetical protein
VIAANFNYTGDITCPRTWAVMAISPINNWNFLSMKILAENFDVSYNVYSAYRASQQSNGDQSMQPLLANENDVQANNGLQLQHSTSQQSTPTVSPVNSPGVANDQLILNGQHSNQHSADPGQSV